MQSRALGAAAMAGVGVAVGGAFAAAATTHSVNPGGTAGRVASSQAAMDDARNGDIIAIDAGTYVENLHSPNGRTITLRGAGAGLTVIDAGGNFAAVSSQGVITLRDLSTQNASVMCLQLNIGRLERVHVSNCGSFGVGAYRLSLVDSTVESANVCLQVSISGRLERAQISNCGFEGVEGLGRLTLVDSTV